jgi:hypothetical protein
VIALAIIVIALAITLERPPQPERGSPRAKPISARASIGSLNAPWER